MGAVDLVELFRGGGWWLGITCFLGGASTGAALFVLASSRTRSAPLSLALILAGALVVVAGLLTSSTRRAADASSVASHTFSDAVSPEAGEHEHRAYALMGVGMGALPIAIGCYLLSVRSRLAVNAERGE